MSTTHFKIFNYFSIDFHLPPYRLTLCPQQCPNLQYSKKKKNMISQYHITQHVQMWAYIRFALL